MYVPQRPSWTSQLTELVLLCSVASYALIRHQYETGLLPLALLLCTVLLAVHKGTSVTKARTARLRRCFDPLGLACGAAVPLALLPSLPPDARCFALASAVTTLTCAMRGGVNKWTVRVGTPCCLAVAMSCIDGAGREGLHVLLAAFVPMVQSALVNACERCFTAAESAIAAAGVCGVVAMAVRQASHFSFVALVEGGEPAALRGMTVAALLGCVLAAVVGVGDALRVPAGGVRRRVVAVVLGVIVPTYAFAGVFGAGCEPVGWVVRYVLGERERLWAMGLWGGVAGAAMLGMQGPERAGVPGTVARKMYHGAALAIFGGGAMLDGKLSGLAGAVGLGLLVLMEMGRICGVGRVERFVHEIGGKLVDEKDRGVVKLTHIYLLVGCALPIWVETLGGEVGGGFAAGGLVTTCVLDSVAAAAGRRWGRMKWAGGRGRTVEGSACGLVAAVGFARVWGEVVKAWAGWGAVLVGCLVACVLEATTAQIDNLVLPLAYCAVIGAARPVVSGR